MQARVVGGGREAIAEDLIDVRVQRVRHVRMSSEEVKRPRQRVRRRLVAGEEERHRLVAELRVGHAAPCHSTPATPCHGTPCHATPCHAAAHTTRSSTAHAADEHDGIAGDGNIIGE